MADGGQKRALRVRGRLGGVLRLVQRALGRELHADVLERADHLQRLAGRVAHDHPAAIQHPQPVAALARHAIRRFETRRLAVDVRPRRRRDAIAVRRMHVGHPRRVARRRFVRTIAERPGPPRARVNPIGRQIPLPDAFADDVHRELEAAFVRLNQLGEPLLFDEGAAQRQRAGHHGPAQRPVPSEADDQEPGDDRDDRQQLTPAQHQRAGRQRGIGYLVDDALRLEPLDGRGDVLHRRRAAVTRGEHVGPRVERDLDELREAGIRGVPAQRRARSRRGIDLSRRQHANRGAVAWGRDNRRPLLRRQRVEPRDRRRALLNRDPEAAEVGGAGGIRSASRPHQQAAAHGRGRGDEIELLGAGRDVAGAEEIGDAAFTGVARLAPGQQPNLEGDAQLARERLNQLDVEAGRLIPIVEVFVRRKIAVADVDEGARRQTGRGLAAGGRRWRAAPRQGTRWPIGRSPRTPAATSPQHRATPWQRCRRKDPSRAFQTGFSGYRQLFFNSLAIGPCRRPFSTHAVFHSARLCGWSAFYH